jgi:putative aldouronate transport system substrate-binding protein
MRKTVILFLVLLSVALVAWAQPPQEVKPAATAPAAAAAYTGKLPLSAEKVTLRFATHQGTNSAMAKPSNDLPVYQQLEKITNVRIEWETVPYNSYKEVMTTRIAAGSDLPDILNLSFLGNYAKLATDGIIIPQNDLIKQYGYYINEFFKGNPGYKAMMTAPDGNIYCVEDTVLDSHLSIMPMINKYAMQRAGLGMPTTVTEFTNLLKAFRDKDINGNGQKDEVPFVTMFSQNDPAYIFQLANAFDLEMTWGGGTEPTYLFRVRDGKMQSQLQLPEFKAFLTWMAQLYADGLINKDLTSANYDRLIEYVSKGQAGMVSFWSTYAYLFGGASPDNQGDKDGMKAPIFVPMTPLKSPSGAQYYSKRLSLNGDGMGITTKCAVEKRPVAMKWIDYLFNGPEAMMTQQWGVEGLSYTKDAAGNITKKTPEGKEWSAYVTEIGGNQPPRAHQQLLAVWRSWMPQWLEDLDATYQKYYKEPSIVAIQFTVEESDTLKAKVPDLTTFVFENVTKFILGQKPMSEFEAFSAELDKRGIKDVQKIYEARYARQAKALGK